MNEPANNPQKSTFFDFAAHVGLTKHIGGVEATEAIIESCHIGKGKYVLDVGCGVGVTPCFIARRYDCKVVGVDIVEGMVERCRERAKRMGLTDRVEFMVADAQDLPFEDDLFDAVITESVTAFPEDKQKAVSEYARVTKPGGYVGLNESTWLKVPPPPELIEWVSQDVGTNAKPLSSGEWAGLLETAGLKEIKTKTLRVKLKEESKGILRRYGFTGMLRVFWRMIVLRIKSPDYRKLVKEIQKVGIAPDNLYEYFGYGLYVGRK